MHTWPDVDPELLKLLPPVLKAVVRALGFAKAKEWLHDYGGINVTIPKIKATALSLEAEELDRLRDTLAPHMDAAGRVTMPKADKLMALWRNEAIRKSAGSKSIAQQAREWNLSARHITNIRRDEEDQLSLF